MSHLVPDVPGMLRQIGTVPGPGADPDLASLVTLSLDDSPAARALATATARLAGPGRAGPVR